MAKAVVEGKRIDAKIQKKDQKLQAAQGIDRKKMHKSVMSYTFLSLKINVLRLKIKLKKEE